MGPAARSLMIASSRRTKKSTRGAILYQSSDGPIYPTEDNPVVCDYEEADRFIPACLRDCKGAGSLCPFSAPLRALGWRTAAVPAHG
jgi:hypothetical protein